MLTNASVVANPGKLGSKRVAKPVRVRHESSAELEYSSTKFHFLTVIPKGELVVQLRFGATRGGNFQLTIQTLGNVLVGPG